MRCRRRAASRILPCDSSPSTCWAKLVADVPDRDRQLFRGRHEVLGRIDVDLQPLDQQLAGERIDSDDALDFVAEELDANRDLFVGGVDLERVAADAEGAADQGHVVAVVLDVDQVAHDLVAPQTRAAPERDDGVLIFLRRAETVNARNRGDDQRVAAGQQRAGRGMTQLVDFVVDVASFSM